MKLVQGTTERNKYSFHHTIQHEWLLACPPSGVVGGRPHVIGRPYSFSDIERDFLGPQSLESRASPELS